MKKRTLFIGDVHGCYDELVELMSQLRPTPSDRVIFLWDILNKGPKSAEVIEYVFRNGYECLLGNHELAYIHEQNTTEKFQQIRNRISPEAHEWIRWLPISIHDDSFIAVHAGFPPDMNIGILDQKISTRIRTWNRELNTIGWKDDAPWYEYYTGQKPIIYGHWAEKGLNIRHNTVGIDTGCVYGKKLSAYILETQEIIQVHAQKSYEVPGIHIPS